MTAPASPLAERLDPAAVADARRAAQDRLPDGRPAARFVWARHAGAEWLIPACLPRPECRRAEAVSAPIPFVAGNGRAAFRLATAVRQDLWRALKSVRGLLPVVRLAPEGPATRITAGVLLTRPPPDSLGPALAALFTPARVAQWTRHARGRRPARSTDKTRDPAPCSPRS